MSLDMQAFLGNVKRAAVEAVAASNPFAFVLGTVTSVSPLTVQVDQKLQLGEAQLILTNAVRDYCVEMTTMVGTGEAPHYTENESGGAGDASFASHSHKYQGRKKWKVHLALKAGEQVLLMRTDGGQKFIILDRVEALK